MTNVFMAMMMTIIFPGGVSYDITVQTVAVPTMEQCVEVLKEAPNDVLVAEDGTIIHTYFECGKET